MFKFLKAYLNQRVARKWLIINLISSIIGNILILLAPLYLGFSVNHMIGVNDVNFNQVILYLVIVAILYLVGSILLWLAQIASHRYSIIITQNLKEESFKVIKDASISYLDQQKTGDLVMRFSYDCDQVYDATSFFFTYFFASLATILFTTIMLIVLNIYLALVVLLTVPAIYLFSKISARQATKHFKDIQMLTGKLTSQAEETFDQSELIISYNYQEYVHDTFKQTNDKLYQVANKGYFIASITNPSFRLIQNLGYALLGIIYFVLFLNDSAPSVGTFTSILLYSAMFARPLNELSALTSQFLSGSASYNRIEQLLNDYNKPHYASYLNNDVKGKIEFEDVSFNYDVDIPIITDFNLTVDPGQLVAIVGPTGAGKSTMISLLMRYYEINGGQIKLDGIDIRDYNINNYRQNFGLVLQEPWTFEATIYQNICYGKQDASFEEVINAAKLANAHDFIVQFKNGYDTILNEAINLSIGQKQLLTIARAILVNPKLVILDEATSFVDSLMEKKIQEAFLNVMKDKTTFIIAHRLKTIVNADHIIVMDNGKIIEQGSHQELIDKKGFYQDLYDSQFLQQGEKDV